MNRKLVGYLLGAILLIEAACMVPALVVALIYQDEAARARRAHGVDRRVVRVHARQHQREEFQHR